MEILELSFAGSCEQPVSIPFPLSESVPRLESQGVSQFCLGGLSRFRPHFTDGVIRDKYFVPIDPDAQLALSYYQQLELTVSQTGSRTLQLYLGDGLFEFSAHVEGDKTHVRVGIFRDQPFALDHRDAMVIPTSDYMKTWRSVASDIVRACLR